MNIVTSYDPPPIPARQFDWSAVDDSTYDGPGSPIGTGASEADAVADLLEQLEERGMAPARLAAGLVDWLGAGERLNG
jgi:hypothetical protein